MADWRCASGEYEDHGAGAGAGVRVGRAGAGAAGPAGVVALRLPATRITPDASPQTAASAHTNGRATRT